MFTITRGLVDAANADYRLSRKSESELTALKSKMLEILPLASNPLNRRDTEALVIACSEEITRRFS